MFLFMFIFLLKCVQLKTMNNSRLSKEIKSQPNALKRYIWYINTLLVTVINSLSYSMLGIAFANIPQSYQWILAVCSPLVEDIFKEALVFACRAGRQSGVPLKSSIMLILEHYMTAKQEIFLAIVIGGVATPASSNIIIAMDGAKAIYSGLMIIYKSKRMSNFNIEGTHIKTDVQILNLHLMICFRGMQKSCLGQEKEHHTITIHYHHINDVLWTQC